MAKFRVKVGIGLVNAYREDVIEVDDEELEGLEGDARERLIFDEVEVWASQILDYSFEEVGE